jgi:hypothetical protein
MTPQASSKGLFGIGILSSILSGVGQYESGQQQKRAYDYNADITIENMRAQMEASQQKFTALVGQQASSYAASGVDIASGSPLLIMAATKARGAQEGEQIREAGTEEADLQRYYGKVAAFSGTMGGIGSFLKGVTSAYAGYYQATATAPAPTVPTPPSGWGA